MGGGSGTGWVFEEHRERYNELVSIKDFQKNKRYSVVTEHMGSNSSSGRRTYIGKATDHILKEEFFNNISLEKFREEIFT